MKEKYTTDHDEIRGWLEERGGYPATISRTLNEDDGISSDAIEISFDVDDPHAEEISWEDFFDMFERDNLAMRYREEDEKGDVSSFEFVDRDEVREELDPGTEMPDSGDPEELYENLTPDAEPNNNREI